VIRKRPTVHLTLSPDAISRLAEIASRRGESRSSVVEKWIRDEEMPRPRTGYATRKADST
jgi:predicted transcriptional regulator